MCKYYNTLILKSLNVMAALITIRPRRNLQKLLTAVNLLHPELNSMNTNRGTVACHSHLVRRFILNMSPNKDQLPKYLSSYVEGFK